MPKIIVRCNYQDNAPAEHLSNYVKYVGTRAGVERIDESKLDYLLAQMVAEERERAANLLEVVYPHLKIQEDNDASQESSDQ